MHSSSFESQDPAGNDLDRRQLLQKPTPPPLPRSLLPGPSGLPLPYHPSLYVPRSDTHASQVTYRPDMYSVRSEPNVSYPAQDWNNFLSHSTAPRVPQRPPINPYPNLDFSRSAPPPPLPSMPPSALPPKPPLASTSYHSGQASPPPIPPKPAFDIASPKLQGSLPVYSPPLPRPPKIPVTDPHEQGQSRVQPNDDDDLAFALALSQSELAKQKAFNERLEIQEKEDLERALAESMASAHSVSFSLLTDSSRDGFPPGELGQVVEESMQRAEIPHSPILLSASVAPERFASTSLYPSSPVLHPEVFASSLSIGHGEVTDNNNLSSTLDKASLEDGRRLSNSELPYLLPEDFTSNNEGTGSSSHDGQSLGIVFTIADDAALALQLAAEEEEQLRMSKRDEVLSQTLSPSNTQQPDLPAYTPRDSEDPFQTQPAQLPIPAISDNSVAVEAVPPVSLAPYARSLAMIHSSGNGVRDDSPESRLLLPTSSISYPQIPSSTTGFNLLPEESTSPSSTVSDLQPDVASPPFPNLSRMPSANSSVSQNTPSTSSNQQSPSLMSSPESGALNLNHFVDAELLYGVSIGFSSPTVSSRLSPMTSSLPNVISMPYGRSPPLHLHAPSWQQALRLLARMSGSRMEPAVEALAVTKNDNMKLRTVIQFVKPHPSAEEWRTVLWFSIDHPIPAGTRSAHKYHNHNVNTLPWSYTLSKVPDLLRDAADSPVSKTYTIPSSDAVPYPTLPISVPDLARYLQAALDDSRNCTNDSSSGLRKLAKMVETCYPTSHEGSDPPERTSVKDMFKRAMGRGNKAKKGGGGGNVDTYQLVTPFVPDEWG